MKHLEYEEAFELLLSHTCAKKASHTVLLPDALRCVSAEDVYAKMDQPPFDRSPLDGFALISGDTEHASEEKPVSLAIAGTVLAGDCADYRAVPGQAFRIMTGARLPFGADCVIRQEEVSADADTVQIFRRLGRYENYCMKGEDVPKWQLILAAGERIASAHIGLLAAQGVASVRVIDRPVIGLFSTGNELVEQGEPIGSAQIYDSNSYLFEAELKALGVEVRRLPPQIDVAETLTAAVRGLWETCDAVITTGGVSEGLMDLMPRAAEALGGELLFHRVNIKPGTPLLALEKDGKLLLALPGNPFAAMATFELFARPMVHKLSGLGAVGPEREKAVLREDYHRRGSIRLFIRATLKNGIVSVPKGNHSPGALLAAAGCNCLIDVPESVAELRAGDIVDVIRTGAFL